MASAIMDGLATKGACLPGNIICSDKYEPSLAKARAKGMIGTMDNDEVIKVAKDAIILAVKPNDIPSVCTVIAESKTEVEACIISIAAGVSKRSKKSCPVVASFASCPIRHVWSDKVPLDFVWAVSRRLMTRQSSKRFLVVAGSPTNFPKFS
jgi:hypothetical protein